MTATRVSVKFHCEVANCECDVIVEAEVFGRESSRLYEYKSLGGECPRCQHRLFARHRPVGEVWQTATPATSAMR